MDDTQVAELPDSEVLQPVEIEVEADAASEGAPDPKAAPAPVEAQPAEKRPKTPRDFQTLRTRAQAAEQERDELRRQLETERAEKQVLQAENTTSSRAAIMHYERALNVEIGQAERDLQDAISAGDAAAQAAANRKLAEKSGEKLQVDTWKANNPAPSADRTPPVTRAPVQQQQQRQVHIEPRTAAWLADNPWMNPEAADFDEEQAGVIGAYARTLETRLTRSGKGAEIGSDDYFAKIDEFRRREFPDAFEEEPAPAARSALPPMQRGGAAQVAPVTRGAPANGKAMTKISLSADERKLAHNLASSGAITGPGNKRLSPQEAEVVFARQKMADAAARKV